MVDKGSTLDIEERWLVPYDERPVDLRAAALALGFALAALAAVIGWLAAVIG